MLLHIALATLLASSYVAVIKINVPVLLRAADRNEPDVIRYRMSRVSLLCLAILVLLPPALVHLTKTDVLSKENNGNIFFYRSVIDVVRQFGLFPGFSQSGSVYVDLYNLLRSVALMCILYVGPITHYVYAERQNIRNDFFFSFNVLTGVRDHIFAPVTEEFVYRAAVVATLKPVLTNSSIIRWLPLLFGVAHAHHGFQLYHVEGHLLGHSLLHVVMQMTYTTVFGLLANKIYLATQCNLLCVIVVHGMCNLMGFPSVDFRQAHPKWFWVYCGMLVGGVYLFCRQLSAF